MKTGRLNDNGAKLGQRLPSKITTWREWVAADMDASYQRFAAANPICLLKACPKMSQNVPGFEMVCFVTG
jgi:hypothetical protein